MGWVGVQKIGFFYLFIEVIEKMKVFFRFIFLRNNFELTDLLNYLFCDYSSKKF